MQSFSHILLRTLQFVGVVFFLSFALPFFTFLSSAQTGTNLIRNGGFEIPSSTSPTEPDGFARGRWGINTATFTYPTVSEDGSRAAEVNLESRTSGDAKWSFSHVPIQGGHTYEYRNRYKATVPTYVTVEYRLTNGAIEYVDLLEPTSSASWSTASVTFTAPDTAISATVFHLINRVGTLTIDNLELTDVSNASNHIRNPSLEETAISGDPAFWSRGRWGVNTASFTFPVPPHSGNKAARVDISSYTSGDAKWHFPPIATTAGESYEFSDYYQSGIPTYVTVQFRKNDGNISYLDLGIAPAASDWREFRKTFTIPPGVISFTVFHVLKGVGSLSVDSFALTSVEDRSKLDKGYVSLSFDDGWRSAYETALPIMDSVNFSSDQFIITERLSDNFPGYVKAAEVLDMQNRGHRIGAHTQRHKDLTTLSESNARSEIEGSRQDLLNIGASPVQIFAYPMGAYNSTTERLVREAGFIAGRSSDGGYNDKNTNPYALRRQPMTRTTTLLQVKNYIDTAIQNKTWVILLFHRVDESGDTYAITPTLFQQIIHYLTSQNVKPITIEEGVQILAR